MHDLRYALRSIAARPWFSLAIIATLALGIGINTTVFTLVNAVLFRPLPFPNGDRLVTVANTRVAEGDNRFNVSYLDLQDLRAQSSTLAALEGASIEETVLSESALPPERIRTGRVSAGFFDLVQATPVLGRPFQPSDDAPGAPVVVMLGYDVWTNRYRGLASGDRSGCPIDESPATIVGVMPQGFQFPNREQIWIPLSPNQNEREKRDARNLLLVGLLKPGVTVLAGVGGPGRRRDAAGRRAPHDERGHRRAHPDVQRTLQWRRNPDRLSADAGCGGLCAADCVRQRRQHDAQPARWPDDGRWLLRAALGASRWRLVRQLLVESVLLSSAGGLLGLGLATAGVRAFDAAVQDTGKPSWIIFSVDYVVLAYCAGRLRRLRHPVRTGAGPAQFARAVERHSEGGWPIGQQPWRTTVGRARHFSVRSSGRAAGRRRPADSEFPREPAGQRLRYLGTRCSRRASRFLKNDTRTATRDYSSSSERARG